jgi:flagellar biosynthesis protein FliP
MSAKARPISTLALLAILSLAAPAAAQDVVVPERSADLPRGAISAPAPLAQSSGVPTLSQLPDLAKRENLSSAMQIIVILTVLSLAPAILIMMTSFTRIIIVMSLLRQALGTQQLPPNQILIGLSLFMTFLVMRPTWTRVNDEALQPYLDGKIDQRDALGRAQVPLREFMIRNIERSGNEDDVYMFAKAAGQENPKSWGEVGTMTLIPAFVLSELKTAFLLGFKIYLPFLIIDMVISAVLISMGMMMLPPVLISLPFKLLLFVLVNGWHLITGSLMGSFVT